MTAIESLVGNDDDDDEGLKVGAWAVVGVAAAEEAVALDGVALDSVVDQGGEVVAAGLPVVGASAGALKSNSKCIIRRFDFEPTADGSG